jgi:hypothetical protein
VELVGVVELFEELTEAAGSEFGIGNAEVEYVDDLLGLGKLQAAARVHFLVLLLQRFNLEVVKLVFPLVVCPSTHPK